MAGCFDTGDRQWLERRRLQTAGLFAQGKTQAKVAGELGVSAQTTSRWYARWRDGGVARMRTAAKANRPSLAPPSWPRSAPSWARVAHPQGDAVESAASGPQGRRA
jgi:hypothetical protein